MMTFADLIDLCRRLRAAQRRYGLVRLPADLQEVRRLEMELDHALADLPGPGEGEEGGDVGSGMVGV